MTDVSTSEQAAQLHGDAVVWDMLIPWMFQTNPEARRRILESAEAGGYTYLSLTVGDDQVNLAGAVHTIAKERAFFLASTDKYVLVETVDDVLRAKQEGKIAVSFHFQGTLPIDYDVHMVEVYYR